MSDPFDPYYVWLGIPPEEQPPNYYRLLGLRPFETNPDVISNAVDQRRTFLRTVQGGKRAAQSQKLLNEVSAAGVHLLDPAKKIAYDEELRRELAPPELPPEALPAATLLAQSPAPIVARPPRPAVARGKKKRPSRDVMIAAVLVSGAAAVLVLAAAAAWWLVGRQRDAAIANVAPARPAIPDRVDHPAKTTDPILPPEAKTSETPESSAASSPASTTNVDAPQPPAKPKAKFGKPKAKAAKTAVTTAANSQAAANVARPTPPQGDQLSKATEEARKIFASDLKAASTTTQKGVVAGRILDAGKETKNDSAARYALINLARTLYVQAGEVQDAINVARILEGEFEVPRDMLVTATIEDLDDASLTPDRRVELARLASQLAQAAVDAEEFERADKLSLIAVQTAAKQRDAELRKEIAQSRFEVSRLVKSWNAIKPSLEKLKTDSADKAAHLAVGRFYCFDVEDFHRGLPHLAQSSEPLLADAAAKDIAAGAGGAARRLEAALAWQQAGGKITDRDDKVAIMRREKWLLEHAVSGLSGLDETKAKKRLDDLNRMADAKAGSASPRPTPVNPKRKKGA
jgi:hypothetical protein